MEEETIIQTLLTKEEITKQLLTLPDKLLRTRQEIIKKQQYINQINRIVERLETEVISYVTKQKEVDDKGGIRKAYPNEISRQAEIQRQLSEDENYNKYKEEIEKEELEKEELQAKEKHYYNTLKSYHLLVPLYYTNTQ